MYSSSPGHAIAQRPESESERHNAIRWAMLLAPLLAVLLWSRETWAQTTALTTFNPATDLERTGDPYTSSKPYWINYADCAANDVFTFSISLDDTSNPVEIWAGSDDCAANRGQTPNNRGQCWIVGRETRPDNRPEIVVPMRTIVARRLADELPRNDLPVDVCDDSTDPSGEPLTYYIMAVDAGKALDSIAWTGGAEGAGFDTLGPEPPRSISVGVGENQLAIGVDINDDDDLERLEAFCVPAGTDGPVPPLSSDGDGNADDDDLDADAGTDAGPIFTETEDGTGAAPSACFTPILRAGARPPVGFSCGVASKNTGTINTKQLVNQTAYAVGIAGQDTLGNAGVLSSVQCGTPILLNDFYELYATHGGPGGGGFCNLSPRPMTHSSHAMAWLGVLFAGLLWRRGRNRA